MWLSILKLSHVIVKKEKNMLIQRTLLNLKIVMKFDDWPAKALQMGRNTQELLKVLIFLQF